VRSAAVIVITNAMKSKEMNQSRVVMRGTSLLFMDHIREHLDGRFSARRQLTEFSL
jgi:hypothetical protein